MYRMPAALPSALLCLAALLPTDAQALQYRADFLIEATRNCTRSFCFDGAPGGSFSALFSLQPEDLAVDDVVDLAASISLGQLHRYDQVAGATQSWTATADIVAGQPVGLNIQYNGSYSVVVPIFGTSFGDARFSADAGRFSSSDFAATTFVSGGSSSSTHSGSFTIAQVVPEPATAWLAAAGLLGLAVGRSRARYSAVHASLASAGRAARPGPAA